jgi:type IV pilus assembly protein PilX
MKQQRHNCNRQTGAALVIGLILLLVMTLLGVTAMRGTTLQERMAGALSDQNVAFQAAETALRQGEGVLDSVTAPNFSIAGWYDQDDGKTRPDWPDKASDPADTGAGVITYATPSGGAGSQDMGWSAPPEFYIERMPPVVITGASGASKALGDGTVKEEYELYRVVARGFGKNQTTVAVVESIYRR